MKVMICTRNKYFLILTSLMWLCFYQSTLSANEWVVSGKLWYPGCDTSVPNDCWDNVFVKGKKAPVLEKKKCEEVRDFLRKDLKENGLATDIDCIFGYQGD